MDVLSHCSIWLPYLTKGERIPLRSGVLLLRGKVAEKSFQRGEERKSKMKKGERDRRGVTGGCRYCKHPIGG